MREVSRRTGIPIRGVGVLPGLIGRLPDELRELAFPVERRMRLEWLEGTE